MKSNVLSRCPCCGEQLELHIIVKSLDSPIEVEVVTCRKHWRVSEK